MQIEGEEIAARAGHAIEAEVGTCLGTMSITRDQWASPIDRTNRPMSNHLQLSLLPHWESGAGCFTDHWSPNRFEQIGSLFLTPAGQTLRVRSECRAQQAVVYRFTDQTLARWFEDGIDWTNGRLEGSLDIGDGEIRRLLIRMGAELRNPGFASDAVLELLAAQTVIGLVRYLRGIGQPEASGGLSPWRLRRIDDYLAANPARVSLGDLAGVCDLSIRQLTRAFRASKGRSLGDYIASQKIERAKALLLSGRVVKSVAQELGFSSPSNFSAAFLRATGERPRTFRQSASRR